jgi:hypothetical protein
MADETEFGSMLATGVGRGLGFQLPEKLNFANWLDV